jgi:CDP-diacylglycerol--serine O-phosphatidyltransferase
VRAWIPNALTTINLLGGVVAVCLCIDGRPFEAGVAVMLGYALGDALDGWAARKLGIANQFGAEYDTIADHTSHIIAPAAIVYTVYKDVGLLPGRWGQALAIALAAVIIVASSIRHARNIVAPVKYKGVWAGLPRTVLGFIAIGYCNATLAPYAPGGWWLGVILIPALSIATLSRLPFPSHHLPAAARAHRGLVTVLTVAFFTLTFGLLLVKPRFMFDMLFFWMAGYTMSAWLALTLDERKKYGEAVALAKQQALTGL